MENTISIAKVLKVVDTREFVEVTDEKTGRDKWVPVPGSGIENQCGRCGREHEVHATVEMTDGSTAVVGTGCMKGDSMLPEVRSGARLATRVKKMEAMVAALDAKLASRKAVLAEVASMTPPAVTIGLDPKLGLDVARCGEGWALCREGLTPEREKCAINGWKEARALERGSKPVHDDPSLRRRLETAKKKVDLAPLTAGSGA